MFFISNVMQVVMFAVALAPVILAVALVVMVARMRQDLQATRRQVQYLVAREEVRARQEQHVGVE